MNTDNQPEPDEIPGANLLTLPEEYVAREVFSCLTREDLEQVAVWLLCQPQAALDAELALKAKEDLWGGWQTAQMMAAKYPDYQEGIYIPCYWLQDHISHLEEQDQRIPRHWSEAHQELESQIQAAKARLNTLPAPPRPDFPEVTKTAG